jgi:hypothetical protein
MEILMGIIAGIGLTNIGILTTLLIIYIRIYKNSKATFATGLIFFVALLMLHNIIAVYAYFAMDQFYAIRLLPYLLAIHIAELGGLSILLRTTLL